MRVLVCGGRNYSDRQELFTQLDGIHRYGWGAMMGPIGLIIHGAARGADTLAGAWALINRMPVSAFPADWTKHGKGAGPIRNQQMLDSAKPDLVVAFRGGRGTADMVKRAKAARVPVAIIGDALKAPTDSMSVHDPSTDDRIE